MERNAASLSWSSGMGNAGRSGTAWLIVLATAWTSLSAETPEQSDQFVPTSSLGTSSATMIPADGPLDPQSDRFDRDAGKASVRSLQASTAVNAVVPSVAYETASRWVTVMGDVEKAGSYELKSKSLSMGELLERCGGPAGLSNHAVHLVREGRPAGPLVKSEAELRPGDLVVVQSLEPHSTGNSVVLGLIGLAKTPVAINMPADFASVDGVLQRCRQSQISPNEVTILIDGAREVPFGPRTRLPDGSVLVFDASRVDRDRLPELPTNRFELGEEGTIVPAGRKENTASNDDSNNASHQRSNAAPQGHITILDAPDQKAELTDLPPVRPLGPPPPPPESGSPADGHPRTADASGAVAIGPPETESHIVEYPSGEFPPPTEETPQIAAAPDPPPSKPEPVGLPVEENTDPAVSNNEKNSSSESQDWDLWPFVLMALVLGGGTYFLIRAWGDGTRRDALGERLRDWIPGMGGDETKEIEEQFASEESAHSDASESGAAHGTVAPTEDDRQLVDDDPGTATGTDQPASRAEWLAALATGRLTFREEPVELPRSLFIHGRCRAAARRRVDPDAEVPAAPHLNEKRLETPMISSRTSARHEKPVEEADVPFDPREAILGTDAARRFGTPFEQALARLRESPASAREESR